MAGLRAMISGQTGIRLLSFLWAGARRTDKSYIPREVRFRSESLSVVFMCEGKGNCLFGIIFFNFWLVSLLFHNYRHDKMSLDDFHELVIYICDIWTFSF